METPMELACQVMAAICNPTRHNITRHIVRERKATYTELKNLTHLTGTSLNFHLKVLMKARILERTTERGPYKITRIGQEGLKTVDAMEREIEVMK